MSPSPHLLAAVERLDAGDVDGLRALLRADPALVRARVEQPESALYDGYFHGATLLHHVAGNPVRRPLPANAPELARALLEAGAEVDAVCGGGPRQPGSRQWTTLGLVASSAAVAGSGRAAELVDVLLEHGANVDFQGGLPTFTALYHTTECRRQRELAELLHARGAPADLAFAAGLGEVALTCSYLTPSGPLAPGAYSRYRADTLEDPTREQVLAEALLFAALTGRVETLRVLLDAGAPVSGRTRLASCEITPLHAACWAGWAEAAELLCAAGADRDARDPTFGADPAGWAEHCGHAAVAARVRGVG